MKKLIALSIISLVALTGCLTPAQKQMTCDTAKAAYQAYITVMNAGGEPSQEQIIGAAEAGVFLTLYCGWESPGPVPANMKAKIPVTDEHGVLRICPQQ